MRWVSLGDSVSCGAGVGLRIPAERTWVGLLAAAAGAEHRPLAAPGARLADVVADQLPVAVGLRAEVVSLLVGLNDLSRSGFETAFAPGLLGAARALAAPGTTLLLVRLHDPTTRLPMPANVRALVHRRLAVVNAAVDAAASATAALVLDLAAVPGLGARSSWAVDRLHPSAAGHTRIARAAANLLRQAGAPMSPVDEPASGATPSWLAEARWFGRHGLPWLLSQGREVTVPLLRATAHGALPTGS